MGPNNASVQFDLKTYATDFVPDGLAADTLRSLIHQQDEQLKSIDDEIAQLRVRLHALEQQRPEVAKSRRLHQAFLAPIRKLAPELLGEVFIQYGLGVWNALKNDWAVLGWPAHTSDFRLLLLQVCQRWRRIAIGTPGLWTLLPINFSPQIPRSRVQICLDNSGCLPIQVHLANHNYEASPKIRLLLDNFHRVQEIKGCISPLIEEILRPGFMFLPTPLRLTVVHVIWRKGSSGPSEDERIHLKRIIQAPPIESLELKDCAFLFSVFCRKPEKLQHLVVDETSVFDMYIPALLDVLPFSSSLRSLDLLLPKEMMAIREDVRAITLPHLRSLSVTGPVEHVSHFLAVLGVPSLDRLTLCSGRFPRAADVTLRIPTQSFLQGDPPPLRSLTLDHVSLERGFVDFISRLFHLEYLRLDMCRITAEHLGVFVLDSHFPRGNIVCPRLATLSLNETTLPGDVLVQVVRSRAPLSGIPWENRCLRHVKAWCLDLEDHSVALEAIREACGGRLTLLLRPRCTWNDGW